MVPSINWIYYTIIILIGYDPSKLYRNTPFELEYSLQETSAKWKNKDLTYSDIHLLKDNSYNAKHHYKHYSVDLDFSPEYKSGAYSHDGWYTLSTVILPVYDINETVIDGALRYNVTTERVIYKTPEAGVWNDLATNIIYNFQVYNIYDELNRPELYNFIVDTKTVTLYNKLLSKVLDNEWFTRVSVIAPKIKTLESAMERGQFDMAQHIINSVNGSLLLLLI